LTDLKAFTFAREFILGNNQTGLVTKEGGTVSVVGGESSALAVNVMSGQPEIFYGSGTTQSTYMAPTATVAAWNSFIATAAPSGDIAVATDAPSHSSGYRTTLPAFAAPVILGAIFLVVQ
jgi:carboxypeptidase D